ncbi:MAG: SDR family oxidoreductase, partial [Desulfobacteraceae bacterium]
MEIREPEISADGILKLKDVQFHTGNVCIVSGCATGIGRACAVAAAANQLMVVGLDINDQEAKKTQQLARQMGGQMIFLPTDLTRDNEIVSAVKEASMLGTIKFLLNIAGMQHIDTIENFPMKQYDLMQRVMLRAPFLLSKLTIPHMKNSSDGTGVIGNMASVHGHICTRNKPVYNITKFGLRALSQSISAEGEGKIRSFTVSTGFVKTPLVLKQIPAQAKQRGISAEAVVRDVMMGAS